MVSSLWPLVGVTKKKPLGGTGHTVWESYSAAMFVCEEGGISFVLPVVKDLLDKASDTGCIQHIVLIWSVQNPSEFPKACSKRSETYAAAIYRVCPSFP